MSTFFRAVTRIRERTADKVFDMWCAIEPLILFSNFNLLKPCHYEGNRNLGEEYKNIKNVITIKMFS
jgi:hypothetical protein